MDLLMSHLEGDAKHFVVGIGSSGRYYAEALMELRRQFGHKQKVARAYFEKVTTGPVLASHNASALRQFYTTIRDCINTLTDLGYHSDINGTDVLMRAAKRLPKDRVNHWNRRVAKISGKKEPTLHDLKEWLDECVTIESNPYAVATEYKTGHKSELKERPTPKENQRTMLHTVKQVSTRSNSLPTSHVQLQHRGLS
jgi:hypothetical protein